MTPAPNFSSPPRKPRVAYGIVSHINPDQVMRLIRTCRALSPESLIVVRHDCNRSRLDPQAVRAVGNAHLIEGFTGIHWGGFNQVAPIVDSIQWLLENHDFDWFKLLSGQDYPIQPLEKVEAFLGQTSYDGLVEAKPVEQMSWFVGPQRYLYQYYELPKFKGWGRARRMALRRSDRVRLSGRLPRLAIPQRPDPRFLVGIRPLFSPFRDSFRCYVGSAWFTLNRRAAEDLLKDWKQNPQLTRYYQRVLFAQTESYPQTVLKNNSSLNLLNDDKTYVGWNDHPESGHPDILKAKDFQTLVASGDHFARKFDMPTDGRILDMLDEHLGVRR